MTTAELHKILDNINKKISLKEYQDILYQLKNDTMAFATREEIEKQEQTKKCNWYYGETNGFQIALDLSEHINQNQKAIECLKEIRKKAFGTDEVGLVFDIPPVQDIFELIDNKIKELEENK